MLFLPPKTPWKPSFLGKKIESTIRLALYEYNMFDGIDKLAIALSGGKDSLTLLFFLKEILGRGFPHLPLACVHVNGEFSCGAGVQLSFLQQVCDSLDVPLIVKESTQKLETLECYSCSRERRSLLFAGAKEFGAQAIAFGHHRDDNVQTVLMNLFHKGEFAGTLPKVPMVEYGVTILRPMIFVEEKMITDFAIQNNYKRITCQCPKGQVSLRKKTETLIEEMTALYPFIRENVSRAALAFGSQKALTVKKKVREEV